jgi:hypothetical protein
MNNLEESCLEVVEKAEFNEMLDDFMKGLLAMVSCLAMCMGRAMAGRPLIPHMKDSLIVARDWHSENFGIMTAAYQNRWTDPDFASISGQYTLMKLVPDVQRIVRMTESSLYSKGKTHAEYRAVLAQLHDLVMEFGEKWHVRVRNMCNFLMVCVMKFTLKMRVDIRMRTLVAETVREGEEELGPFDLRIAVCAFVLRQYATMYSEEIREAIKHMVTVVENLANNNWEEPVPGSTLRKLGRISDLVDMALNSL